MEITKSTDLTHDHNLAQIENFGIIKIAVKAFSENVCRFEKSLLFDSLKY